MFAEYFQHGEKENIRGRRTNSQTADYLVLLALLNFFFFLLDSKQLAPQCDAVFIQVLAMRAQFRTREFVSPAQLPFALAH